MSVSIGARKERQLAQLLSSVEQVKAELSAHARRHGGRYVLFGSVARGEARFDSDLDILVDFPGGYARRAWFHAERACVDHGIRPDIHLASEVGGALMARVLRDGIVLP